MKIKYNSNDRNFMEFIVQSLVIAMFFVAIWFKPIFIIPFLLFMLEIGELEIKK